MSTELAPMPDAEVADSAPAPTARLSGSFALFVVEGRIVVSISTDRFGESTSVLPKTIARMIRAQNRPMFETIFGADAVPEEEE